MPLVSFYALREHEKEIGFLMFSGVMERYHWHEMGQVYQLVLWVIHSLHTQNLLTSTRICRVKLII